MDKSDIPDKWVKIGLLILAGLLWFFVGWAIPKSFSNASVELQEAPGQEIVPRANSYYFVEQSFLKAVIIPIYFKPQVLGMMIENRLSYEQAELLNKLWQCEAGLKHEGIWGDKGKAYGAFQFWQSTWDIYCEGERENLDDQIKCASKIIFELGEGPKHWKKCFTILMK